MYYIGIDIGGTNIKLALVDTDSSEPVIAARPSFLFDHMPCDKLCANIKKHVLKMCRETGTDLSSVGGIGLSVPGSIDQTGEILLHAYNMGYHGIALVRELKKVLPGPEIAMLNDANAAALAELKAGVFKGCRNALLLTIGTGVGSGLILNGKVFNGGQNRGCEIGHLPFRNGSDPCTCGQTGCLEVYVSATRLARQGRELMGEKYADAKAVLDASLEGNETARGIIDSYISDLADVIAGLCCALDPEKIALGGGFSAAGEVLYAPLNRLVAERNFYKVPYEIVPAKFLNDAGVIGAAYQAKLTQQGKNNNI